MVRRLPDRLHLLPRTLPDRRPGEVSGGEAQRLALARVMALRPALLVADEPSSRLDPPVQAEALRPLRNCADEQGLAVLLITHSIAAARATSDGMVHLQPIAPERPVPGAVRAGSHGG